MIYVLPYEEISYDITYEHIPYVITLDDIAYDITYEHIPM